MKTLINSLIFVALSCSFALADETTDATEVDHATAEMIVVSAEPDAERTSASANEMAGIWHSMHWAKTDSGRLTVLRAVARGYWLSVMQVEVLLETISNRQHRVAVLAQLYPKITNPQQVDRLKRLLPAGVSPRTILSEVRIEKTAQL